MGLLVKYLSTKYPNIYKHKDKIEFMFNISWWLILIAIMIMYQTDIHNYCLWYNSTLAKLYCPCLLNNSILNFSSTILP